MAEHPENQEQTERKNRRFAVSANRGRASHRVRYVETGGAAVDTEECTFCQAVPDLEHAGELKPLKCLAILTPASVLVVKLKKPTLILRRSQIA